MTFADALAAVRSRLDAAVREAGRDPGEVRLVAVSKTHPVDRVRDAITAGCTDLGESRVQELVAKATALADPAAAGAAPTDPADLATPAPRWVMIGPVQTNKARDVARYAHEVQTIERLEVAQALQRRLEAADRSLDVLVQVNTSGEGAKSGVAPSGALALVRGLTAFDRLRVRGLMTIATRGGDEIEARRCFALLRTVGDAVRAEAIDGVTMADLSMGMSGDLEIAIAEGATTIRVGTALFGER